MLSKNRTIKYNNNNNNTFYNAFIISEISLKAVWLPVVFCFLIFTIIQWIVKPKDTKKKNTNFLKRVINVSEEYLCPGTINKNLLTYGTLWWLCVFLPEHLMAVYSWRLPWGRVISGINDQFTVRFQEHGLK